MAAASGTSGAGVSSLKASKSGESDGVALFWAFISSFCSFIAFLPIARQSGRIGDSGEDSGKGEVDKGTYEAEFLQ